MNGETEGKYVKCLDKQSNNLNFMKQTYSLRRLHSNSQYNSAKTEIYAIKIPKAQAQ